MYLQVRAVRVQFFENSPCHGLNGKELEWSIDHHAMDP